MLDLDSSDEDEMFERSVLPQRPYDAKKTMMIEERIVPRYGSSLSMFKGTDQPNRKKTMIRIRHADQPNPPARFPNAITRRRVNANLDPSLEIEEKDELEGGANIEQANDTETVYASEAVSANQLLRVEAQKRALDPVRAWSTSDKNGGGETSLSGDYEAANLVDEFFERLLKEWKELYKLEALHFNYFLVLSVSLFSKLGLVAIKKKLFDDSLCLLDVFIWINTLIGVVAVFRLACFEMKSRKISIRRQRAGDECLAAEEDNDIAALRRLVDDVDGYDKDDDTVDYIPEAEKEDIPEAEENASSEKKKAEEEPSSEDETNDDNDDAILADMATVTGKLKEPKGLGELKIFVLMVVVSLFGFMMVVSFFGFMMAVSLLRFDDGGLVLFVLMMVVARLEDNEKQTHDNENKISIMESEDLAVKVKMASLANTLQHQEQMIGYLRRRPSKLKID